MKFVADCLQKDPNDRPPLDVLWVKHKAFFDKADREEVVRILGQLPPLEQREPTKPPGYQSPRSAARNENVVSGDWNFQVDEEEEAALKDKSSILEDFAGIGEMES